jgi:hypothetical protein
VDNFANTAQYYNYLNQFEYIFNEIYFKESKEIMINNDYKYQLKKYNHYYQVGKNYYYDVNCFGIMLLKNEKIIYETRTVFGEPFCQYIKHKNGKEYFISGNDLLDFSVYNITENEEYKYVNECLINDDFTGDCNNEFWYITDLIYNEHNNFIAINGQDGMNESTVTICDFNEPDNLPYRFKNLTEIIYKKYKATCYKAIEWLNKKF